MTTIILILLALVVVAAMAMSPSGTQGSRPSAQASRNKAPMQRSPQARLKAAARAECEALNQRARQEARATGEWDERAWLHPDDWVRMRSPILLLVATARADGYVHQNEADIIASWVAWRLNNSHWGESYTHAKIKALRELTVRLSPSRSETEDALEDCATAFSKKQRNAFLERVDKLAVESGAPGRELAARIRSRLEVQAPIAA